MKTSNGTGKIQGTISINSKGTGYVKILGQEEDIEIEPKYLHTALNGDTVEIALRDKKEGKSYGEVSRIINREKYSFAGVLEREDGILFLKPDDTKMYTDILVPEKSLHGAKVGQKVFVEIVSWEDSEKSPIGKVIKILGKPGDNNVEMLSIAIEKGFDSDFPHKVEDEAKKIKQSGIKEEDYRGRKDFRKTLTFTIDPYDAKDFDDAISFRIISPATPHSPPQAGGEEFEIGIHIADVSHYVKIGSELDKEAKNRGTSVYLVDRTIPMLPEALSNDLCSLMPNVDRLAMSAVFTIDKNARVKSKWFGKTVIHSQKRFTYEEAEEVIKKDNLPLHKELSILNKLAKKMTKERFENGAMSLDQEEVKFVLDEKGVPTKVIKKVRGDSNRLIEEFMLLANKKVAEELSHDFEKGKGKKDNTLSIYRVHDLPSKEKMEDLAFFLRSLGYKVSLKDGIIPSHEINKILENIKTNEKDTVQRAVIRSMAKAIYSTKNIGHYGLAFKYYTHFTSPIRRYPDVVIHRLLEQHIQNKEIGRDKLQEYEKISRVSSEQEKRASDAERASIKYKQVEYMSSRIGSTWNGVISGVTEWGIYVEEIETKCEGLVRVRDIKDDFYVYDEKKMELVGKKKKKKYKLGGNVKIKVKGVDLERKTIDYALV